MRVLCILFVWSEKFSPGRLLFPTGRLFFTTGRLFFTTGRLLFPTGYNFYDRRVIFEGLKKGGKRA